MQITSEAIWAAIEAIAAGRGIRKDGCARWPSTSSIVCVLEATERKVARPGASHHASGELEG